MTGLLVLTTGSKRPKGVVQEAFEVYKAVLTYSAYWYNNKNSYAFQRFWLDAANRKIPKRVACLPSKQRR